MSQTNPAPQRPNILVCGTPGTGKTTTAEAVAREAGYQHINVGQWVAEKGLHSGWDEEFNCWIIDEDKVCDAMEDAMAEGGVIVDHHGCEFFPERWAEIALHVPAASAHYHTHTHMCTHVHTNTHTHRHAHTYTHTHSCTYKYIVTVTRMHPCLCTDNC